MSHRRRWEKQRESKSRRARIARFEFLLFFITSLVTFSILVALNAVLGRERAVGLCIAAGVFAVAFAIAARLVARDAGKESVRCQILSGLAWGFAIGAVIVVLGDMSWAGFATACVVALLISITDAGAPGYQPKRDTPVEDR